MGVDYSANFGIGFKLDRTSPAFDDEDDIICRLDEIIDSSEGEFYSFEVGQGSYTGEEDDMYICITEPFEDGLDTLPYSVERLLNFMFKHQLVNDGPLDVVGGLHVW